MIRMECLLILPDIWASTLWPLGRVTRNMVWGKTWVTVPQAVSWFFLSIYFVFHNDSMVDCGWFEKDVRGTARAWTFWEETKRPVANCLEWVGKD